MAWSLRAAVGLLLPGCLGDPELVSCADRPELAGCEATGTTGHDMLPPKGLCYREPSPLTWTAGGGVWTAANDRFELSFAELENFMPRRLAALEVSDENLLYAGSNVPERLMGVQLHDEFFSWEPDDESVGVVAWEQGGAVVRLSIEWDGDGIESHYPTRYTITPDGRMTRREVVLVEEVPDDGLWLNAYVALDAQRFDRVDVRGEVTTSRTVADADFHVYPDADPIGEQNLERVLLCAVDMETGIAVGIGGDPRGTKSDNLSHPPAPGGYGWGFRASHPIPASLGLQFDWGRDFEPTATAYFTHSCRC